MLGVGSIPKNNAYFVIERVRMEQGGVPEKPIDSYYSQRLEELL